MTTGRTRRAWRGLLVRRPALSDHPWEAESDGPTCEQQMQLAELEELLRRGLLSRTEFDRQTRKVLDG